MSDNVAVEYLVDDPADVFKNISVRYEELIRSGGVCNVEIVTAGAIELGVDAIEGEGDLGVDIGAERVFGPGGVDLDILPMMYTE